jgi:acetyltransferase
MFTNVSAGLHDDVVSGVRAAGLPLLQGARPALQAIRHLGWYGSAVAYTEPSPAPYRGDPSRFRQAVGAYAPDTNRLGETEAKRILSAYGIPVTREVFAANPLDAVAGARSIGYPVVLKVVSPDIVHKSDIDGVRLNLKSDAEVEVAYREILTAAARFRPSARVAGVLVAEQVPPGVELIVGVKHDLQFGAVVLVGLGGTLVEVLDQVAVRVLPLSADAARDLVGEFPGSAVLAGVRGRPAADIDALVEVLIRVSELAFDGVGMLGELDLNPLIVRQAGAGCTVVDARMVLIDP